MDKHRQLASHWETFWTHILWTYYPWECFSKATCLLSYQIMAKMILVAFSSLLIRVFLCKSFLQINFGKVWTSLVLSLKSSSLHFEIYKPLKILQKFSFMDYLTWWWTLLNFLDLNSLKSKMTSLHHVSINFKIEQGFALIL